MNKTHITELLIMAIIITAKAFGLIPFSWWYVTSPLWITAIYAICTGGIYTVLDWVTFQFDLLREQLKK